MSSSEESELRSFLKSCKSHLTDTSSLQTIHVVIGNEACDLDSVVSALVYAFFLFKRNGTQTTLFVPVLNIPSKKYRLATEVPFALEQHMISADLLTFRDQINLNELHREQKLLLTLVDHNVLHRDDSELASAVCKVIDHHRNQQTETSSVSCMIEPVGSCCTLVAELVLRDPDVTIPEELWSLLYATILLDTVCLSESAGRTTPKDIQHVEILEEKLGKINRKEVFEQLQAARMDVSGLSALDILRKDVKTINNHGMVVSVSSVPNSLKDLFRDRDVDAVLKEFSAHQGAAVVVIMALYLDQQREPHRELAVYSEDILLRDQVSSFLKQTEQPDFGLVPLSAPLIACPNLALYTQLNSRASRKVLLPLVTEWLNGL